MYFTGTFQDYENRLHQFASNPGPGETGVQSFSGFNQFIIEGSGYLVSSATNTYDVTGLSGQYSTLINGKYTISGTGYLASPYYLNSTTPLTFIATGASGTWVIKSGVSNILVNTGSGSNVSSIVPITDWTSTGVATGLSGSAIFSSYNSGQLISGMGYRWEREARLSYYRLSGDGALLARSLLSTGIII